MTVTVTAGAEVEVLLATHNGERFLAEQIQSILAQTWQPLRITASDDGSTDGTVGLLQESSGAVTMLPAQGPSGSAQANFLRLMYVATADYAAFADQDDVWLPDKIARSMQAMAQLEERHGERQPLLVFTDLRVVDAGLNVVAPSMRRHLQLRPQSVHRLPRLIGQTVVTGCTMLINRPLLELARRMPPVATMHDRWIALLAACMGHAAYVDEPTVLYRQHDRNVVGAALQDNTLGGLATRTQDDTGRRAERRKSELQAEALLSLHANEMPRAQAETLRAYLESGRDPSAVRRLYLTVRHGFFRGTLLQTAALLADIARSATNT